MSGLAVRLDDEMQQEEEDEELTLRDFPAEVRQNMNVVKMKKGSVEETKELLIPQFMLRDLNIYVIPILNRGCRPDAVGIATAPPPSSLPYGIFEIALESVISWMRSTTRMLTTCWGA